MVSTRHLIASRARNDKVRQDKKSDQKLLFDYRGYGRVEAVLKERLHGGTLLTRYEEVKLSIQRRQGVWRTRHATAFRAGRLRMPEKILRRGIFSFQRHALGTSFHFFLKAIKCLEFSLMLFQHTRKNDGEMALSSRLSDLEIEAIDMSIIELGKFGTVFVNEDLRLRVERALERLQHRESLLAEMPAEKRQATSQRLIRLTPWLEKAEKMLGQAASPLRTTF